MQFAFVDRAVRFVNRHQRFGRPRVERLFRRDAPGASTRSSTAATTTISSGRGFATRSRGDCRRGGQWLLEGQRARKVMMPRTGS